MKSPFTEYVIALHKDGVPAIVIHEASKKEFKTTSISLFQVQRAIDNFQKGLITETGDFIRERT